MSVNALHLLEIIRTDQRSIYLMIETGSHVESAKQIRLLIDIVQAMSCVMKSSNSVNVTVALRATREMNSQEQNVNRNLR